MGYTINWHNYFKTYLMILIYKLLKCHIDMHSISSVRMRGDPAAIRIYENSIGI